MSDVVFDRLALVPVDQRATNVHAGRYLAGLGSDRSRRAMRGQLARAACILCRFVTVQKTGKPLGGYARVALDAVPWAALDVDALLYLRTRLAESSAPASASLALAAVRGVLATADLLTEAKRKATRAVRGHGLSSVATVETAQIGAMLRAAAADTRPVRRRSKEQEPRTAGIRDGALLGVLACGLRRSEAAGLSVEDYAPGRRMLRVLRSKSGSAREVPVPEGVAVLLDRWLEERGQSLGPFLLTVNRGGRLGGQMSGHSIWKRVLLRAAEAGVGDVSPHALRRWLGGEVIAVSDISTAAKVLGHSSVSTTLRAYDRAPERRVRRAMHGIDLSSWPTVPAE